MKKDKKGYTKGFNLIELMIVILIIGVLAAFAIPNYYNYVIRSKISEALVLAGPAKTEIAMYVNNGGKIPNCDSGALPQSEVSSNTDVFTDYGAVKYISAIRWNHDCAIEIDLDMAEIGVPLSATNNGNMSVILCPQVGEGSIQWQCKYWTSVVVESRKYFPPSCRNEMWAQPYTCG